MGERRPWKGWARAAEEGSTLHPISELSGSQAGWPESRRLHSAWGPDQHGKRPDPLLTKHKKNIGFVVLATIFFFFGVGGRWVEETRKHTLNVE